METNIRIIQNAPDELCANKGKDSLPQAQITCWNPDFFGIPPLKKQIFVLHRTAHDKSCAYEFARLGRENNQYIYIKLRRKPEL